MICRVGRMAECRQTHLVWLGTPPLISQRCTFHTGLKLKMHRIMKLDQMKCVTVHASLVPSMAVKRGNCWRRIIKRDRHSMLGRRLNCRHGSLRHRMLPMLVQMPVSDSRFRNSLTPPSGGRHESTLHNLPVRVQCFCDLISVPVVILIVVGKSITPRSLQMQPDKLLRLPLWGMDSMM